MLVFENKLTTASNNWKTELIQKDRVHTEEEDTAGAVLSVTGSAISIELNLM